jgi:hypothetical protein
VFRSNVARPFMGLGYRQVTGFISFCHRDVMMMMMQAFIFCFFAGACDSAPLRNKLIVRVEQEAAT